ncbi:hypothetical protein BpHYR1_042465 [Brachionus plicatilis]|uniref:Uncharacterized protein n=1 Tax=Brachionus plicatilis TaxID=10195 RepID=A0A3M7S5Z5_BRAPC|nr:hypothetical protein BpHYR1_042465 [Brachionus plicatilis]
MSGMSDTRAMMVLDKFETELEFCADILGPGLPATSPSDTLTFVRIFAALHILGIADAQAVKGVLQNLGLLKVLLGKVGGGDRVQLESETRVNGFTGQNAHTFLQKVGLRLFVCSTTHRIWCCWDAFLSSGRAQSLLGGSRHSPGRSCGSRPEAPKRACVSIFLEARTNRPGRTKPTFCVSANRMDRRTLVGSLFCDYYVKNNCELQKNKRIFRHPPILIRTEITSKNFTILFKILKPGLELTLRRFLLFFYYALKGLVALFKI